jgi:acyl carrier protein
MTGMTPMTPLQQSILAFLAREANLPVTAITATTPLISSALVDSFLVVHLAAHIEEATGVSVPDDFMTADHFDTLDQMQSLVDRLRQKG